MKQRRLTRGESKAKTRASLLKSAFEVVSREGYDNTSVERIAEEAGFSKGAFYSNFGSKEAIFLELLEMHAGQDIDEIKELLDGIEEPLEIIETLTHWIDSRTTNPSWGILALEFFRNAKRNNTFDDRQAAIFEKQWKTLGEMLFSLFPDGKSSINPETLGGLVFELTYGGASRYTEGHPTAGQMVKLALTGIYYANGKLN